MPRFVCPGAVAWFLNMLVGGFQAEAMNAFFNQMYV